MLPNSAKLPVTDNQKSFFIPVEIKKGKTVDNDINTKALIDSGAGGIFMDKSFAEKNHIRQIPLRKQIRVFNVDGTQNKVGRISHYTWIKIQIGQQHMDTRVLITGLESDNLIFGLPWLKRHNPKIDWEKGQMDMEQFGKSRKFSEVLRKTLELSQAQIIIPTPAKQPLTHRIEEIFEIYPEETAPNQPLEDWQPILLPADEPDKDNLDLLRTYIGGINEANETNLEIR